MGGGDIKRRIDVHNCYYSTNAYSTAISSLVYVVITVCGKAGLRSTVVEFLLHVRFAAS